MEKNKQKTKEQKSTWTLSWCASLHWLINGQAPSGWTHTGRRPVNALGIWVGGSLSFAINSSVLLGTVQTDYRLHLPFVYKVPTERGVADAGLAHRSSAWERRRTMDPDTPPPGWLSVGTSPCPYASRTSLYHTPPDLPFLAPVQVNPALQFLYM